jgi:hypothetical protein
MCSATAAIATASTVAVPADATTAATTATADVYCCSFATTASTGASSRLLLLQRTDKSDTAKS